MDSSIGEIDKLDTCIAFPILKVPQLVQGVFIEHLQPTEIFKFSFLSRRTNQMCRDHVRNGQSMSLAYQYPPRISLFLENDQDICFSFYNEFSGKKEGKIIHQNVDKKAVCVSSSPSEKNIVDGIVEKYSIFCQDPVGQQLKWALYFSKIYRLTKSYMQIVVDDKTNRLERFFESFKLSTCPNVYQLDIQGQYANNEKLDYIIKRANVENVLLIDSGVRKRNTDGKQYSIDTYKSTKANAENLWSALYSKCYFIHLQNSDISDNDLNMLINEWGANEDVQLKAVSVRRNYDKNDIDHEVLFDGFFNENEDLERVRTFDWVNENGISEQKHVIGGFDVTRMDGTTLTCFVESNQTNIHGVVYFNQHYPKWHSVNFVVSNVLDD